MDCSNTESSKSSESYASINNYERSNSNDIARNANIKIGNHSTSTNKNIIERNSNIKRNHEHNLVGNNSHIGNSNISQQMINKSQLQ